MRKLKNEELNRVNIEQYRELKKIPLVVVLDNVRSLHNIGSVFRTADAFLIHSIYLCGITARPPQREIEKTALGATASVRWEYFSKTEEALQRLKDAGYTLYGIEQTDKSCSLDKIEINVSQKYGIVFGHEVHGIDEALMPLLDGCIEVPQYGTKHSLNISVCAGIVLWEFCRRLRLLINGLLP